MTTVDPAAPAPPPARPSRTALRTAVLSAGVIAGALDMAAAVLLNRQYPMQTIFQSVASGWLGAEAYRGGWTTAWLGLASHFGIMTVIALIYMVLAARRPELTRRWPVAGVVWGLVCWAVMVWIVVPLSASPLPTPNLRGAVEGIVTQVLLVGLPMAFIAARRLRPRP